MVATRDASGQQKWVCKLVAEPRETATLENIQDKALDIQKQLTEVIF